jgi:hypothetical protein
MQINKENLSKQKGSGNSRAQDLKRSFGLKPSG